MFHTKCTISVIQNCSSRNGANGYRVPVGSRGCRSHSSVGARDARVPTVVKYLFLRKRDIDRNGGRVFYRLWVSRGDIRVRLSRSRVRECSHVVHVRHARCDDRFLSTKAATFQITFRARFIVLRIGQIILLSHDSGI